MIFVSRHYCRLTGLWFLPSYIHYLRYASPFARIGASLLLLRSAPPLIGCRPLLSLSHPHCLPLPCTLLGLPPRVVFSLPTSLLGVTVLRGGVMSYLSWGFPYPPLLFATPRRLPLHYFRLPAASGSLFLSSLPPYLVSISRLLLPPCTRPFSLSQAPTSGRLLPPMGLPCSEVGCG